MKFEYLSKTSTYKSFGYIDSIDAFDKFVEKFDIVGVRWSEPTTISASYFLRLLQDGSSAKARGFGKGNSEENDESSTEMNEFYCSLLDHGALWKLRDGQVICSAMPYGDKESINTRFAEMKNKFSYPSSIQMCFLDQTYHFRSNGDYMIVIYFDDPKQTVPPIPISYDLRSKAMNHSRPGQQHSQTASAYIRDRNISEYAKQRAHGVCQLCGIPAPFIDRDGKPYLESHHIIWLSDGGDDSISNTVALCPNCHRKMHTLNLDDDVMKLMKIAAKVDI